jgi:putative oxidoreductase
MHVTDMLRRLRALGLSLAHRLAFLAPLLARFTIGAAFIDSGWGKVHNLEKVTAYFTELGIPAPQIQATFVSWVELVCGSLILVGLATRLAAVPLICTMLVALITANASDISGISDLVGTIEFTYIALLVVLAIGGGGWVSLDHVLFRRSARTSVPGSEEPKGALRGSSV